MNCRCCQPRGAPHRLLRRCGRARPARGPAGGRDHRHPAVPRPGRGVAVPARGGGGGRRGESFLRPVRPGAASAFSRAPPHAGPGRAPAGDLRPPPGVRRLVDRPRGPRTGGALRGWPARRGRRGWLPSALGYGDYAAWQRRRAAEPAWESMLAWWENHLRGIPALELPTDRPRPARFSGRGAGHRFTLPGPAGADRLRALAKREGTTLFSVLLAGYEAVLGRQSVQEDFGVGVSVAGRTHRGLEELVGMFVNTVVFRASLAGDPSFAGLVPPDPRTKRRWRCWPGRRLLRADRRPAGTGAGPVAEPDLSGRACSCRMRRRRSSSSAPPRSSR